MEKYGVNQLRQMYLDFFASKGHLVMKSFSLVPQGDKSLLLINGKHPFNAMLVVTLSGFHFCIWSFSIKIIWGKIFMKLCMGYYLQS